MNSLDYAKERILSCISTGKSNAIHIAEIADLTGYTSTEIKTVIQLLRRDGYAICSTTYHGYWIANKYEDVETTIRLLQANKDTLQDTILALSETCNKMKR